MPMCSRTATERKYRAVGAGLATGGGAEGADLARRERPVGAPREIAEHDGPEGNAPQAVHGMTEGLAEALDLVLASLGESAG